MADMTSTLHPSVFDNNEGAGRLDTADKLDDAGQDLPAELWVQPSADDCRFKRFECLPGTAGDLDLARFDHADGLVSPAFISRDHDQEILIPRADR